MVKGNKFKPKAPVDVPAEILDDDGEMVPSSKRKDRQAEDSEDGGGAAAQPKIKKAKPAKPIIPTVLAPAPKGTSVSNKAAATSNWESLKAAMQAKSSKKGHKKKKQKGGVDTDASQPASAPAQLTRTLALDCEMVGVGKRGDRSILARVSIVNSAGAVVYDTFVAPTEKVTDYRTKWSGVRHSNLKDAPSFEHVKAKVKELLRGRVLVGHAVHNDLEVLGIDHPESDLRDTSRYPPLMNRLINGRIKPRALRHLAQEHLTIAIQSAEHCSIEDARASLGLYQKHKKEWEKWLSGGGIVPKASSKAVSMPDMGARLGFAHKKSDGPLGAERLAELARSDYMADL